MRETESPCAENIGLKDIARSRSGGTSFLRLTNNVLQFSIHCNCLHRLMGRNGNGRNSYVSYSRTFYRPELSL